MKATRTTSLRILGLAATWALLVLVGVRLVPEAGDLLDARSAAFVLLLPWVVAVAVHGPVVAGRALLDALSSASVAVPPDRRRDGAAVLRNLGGLSFAVGLIGLLGTFGATLHDLAGAGGELEPGRLVLALGAVVLAPIYGLFLGAFVYHPLATALEGPASGPGAELERES